MTARAAILTTALFAALHAQEPITPSPNRPAGEGEGPFDRLVIRGATVIDGTGAPPRGPVDIVILSGCSSGVADALPGTGLMGLTRAWLASGAGSVIASRWATPDDTGTLFLEFYKNIIKNPQSGSAVALQQAQIEMRQSRTWRSDPRYWGAYFVMSNQ